MSQAKHIHENVQLRLGGRASIRIPGQVAGHLPSRLLISFFLTGLFAKQAPLNGRRSFALWCHHLFHNSVGEIEEQFRLHRGDGVEVALPKNLLREGICNGRIDTVQIVQGVAIFGGGQATDHEGAGVDRAQILELIDPLNELLPFLVAGLFGGIFGWHVMHLDIGHRLFPMHEGNATPRCLEIHLKIDIRLGSSPSVAARTVLFDEGFHLFLEGFFSLRPQVLFALALSVGLALSLQHQ